MELRQYGWVFAAAAAVIVIGGSIAGAAVYRHNKQVQNETVFAENETLQETWPQAVALPQYTPTPLDVQTPGKAEADITDRLIIQDGLRKAFLTFDDGPSENTVRILDILKQYDVKATFFVQGKNVQAYPDIIRRMYAEGHAVGNHSYQHDYEYLYASPENFGEEVERTTAALAEVVGAEHVQKLFRFPGGSFEAKKDPYKQMLPEMGYAFVDWNALNGDADGGEYTYERITAMFKETAVKHEDSVILMHDTAVKTLTVDALPECIEYLQNAGFTFEAIRVANGTEAVN